MLDELQSIALIGTGRSGPIATPLPAALEQAAARAADPSAEQALLTRAMLLNAYLAAGTKPTPSKAIIESALADILPCCSTRAAEVLSDLLHDRETDLIAEWLAAAAAAKQRAPHRLLPNLLGIAKKEKLLRVAAMAVVDQRGRWLISQNADWRFDVADEALDEALWETGTPEQRRSVLRQAREQDPNRSRTLLQKTWKDDPADARVEFLKVVAVGLSPADEPLLETLLDDRSKQVRTAAAELLGRLPNSQVVQRMITRAAPLLQFKRGLLKSVKVEITLPVDLDQAAQRDGIDKAALPGLGEKQSWLQQLISAVPLSTWTDAASATPKEIIAAVAKTDFADVVLTGFTAAAARSRDAAWIEPLLRDRFEATGRLNRVLLSALPPTQFATVAAEVLNHNRLILQTCSDLINNGHAPLDPSTTRQWVAQVARLASRAAREELSALYPLIGQCAMRISPAARSQIESDWSVDKEPWSQYRPTLNVLLKMLDIRQQIQKEFAS